VTSSSLILFLRKAISPPITTSSSSNSDETSSKEENGEWLEALDSTANKPYFYHSITNEVSWQNPVSTPMCISPTHSLILSLSFSLSLVTLSLANSPSLPSLSHTLRHSLALSLSHSLTPLSLSVTLALSQSNTSVKHINQIHQ